MPFFDWKDDYSVGISTIDEQHKKMINLINEVLESIRDGLEKQIIREILNDLEQYAIYHFAQEEILFQEYGYNKAKEHGQSHEHYIKKIESLKILASLNEEKLSILTFAFLRTWLDNHILKDDIEYGRFIRNKDISIT
jgi:hemerythrin-like metal-binding protein